MNVENMTLEQLAHALYAKMETMGYKKGTDKTKWREVVVADKLGHNAHATISSGTSDNSVNYGSDATTVEGNKAEYKSMTIEPIQLRNLYQEQKTAKTRFAPLTAIGIYNGYISNRETAFQKYLEIEHYIGVFYKEECLAITKVKTDVVMDQLENAYNKWVSKGRKGTTNCARVDVKLGDPETNEIVYWNDKYGLDSGVQSGIMEETALV